MCNCVSCEITDSFADKGFSAWPRGNPSGRKAAGEYQAHVRYSRQWGKDRSPEFSADDLRIRPEPYFGSTGGRGADPGACRRYPALEDAEQGTAHYVKLFLTLNQYSKSKGPELTGPVARNEQPAKAARHLPELDRQREPAVIYAMPKSKPVKRSRGRPAIPGRFVVVKLEERLIAKAEKIGGKVTAGIREALERVKTG